MRIWFGIANLTAPLCVADYRQRVGQPVYANLRLDTFVCWSGPDGTDVGNYGALPARQALCGLAGSDCRHLFWTASVSADRQIVGTAVLSTFRTAAQRPWKTIVRKRDATREVSTFSVALRSAALRGGVLRGVAIWIDLF